MNKIKLKILLTGGNGYLGSALARHLISIGIRPSLVLRATSQLERLRSVECALDICRYKNYSELDQIIRAEEPDVVIHTACSYGRAGEGILQIADANIIFGLQIIQSLQKADQTVTFINTGTVLGPEVNPYSLTKHQFSDLGRMMARQSFGKLRFLNVILQHIYGPGDEKAKFTTYVMQACHRNDSEIRLTAGEQRRDFIYIEDVVGAIMAIVNHCESLGLDMDIEVGTGAAPTVREFVESVHRMTKSTSKLLFGAVPYRKNEAMHCQADVSLISQLGWSPKHSLDSGLQKTIELEFTK